MGRAVRTAPTISLHPSHHLRTFDYQTAETASKSEERMEMGGAAVEVERSGEVRGTARKKKREHILAEERSEKTGREGYARDEERRKISRD